MLFPDDNDELRVLVNTVLLPGGGSCRAWRRRGIVPVPKPHQLFTPSAIDTGGGTYMRPPRADETDMENRRFLALSFFILSCLFCRVLPFLPRCFFCLSCLSCLCVCVLSCLSCFLSLCVSGPDVSCVFLGLVCPCCLVCLAFFMISCPALCLAFFFGLSVLLPCATDIGGTEMERTCGRHVQMEQTCGRHSCWSRQWLLAGYAGACLLAYWPCLLVMLVLGCWLCFLITLLLAC